MSEADLIPCPFVTVVVVNWNGWANTAECIDSLLALDYPAFTVVVVDNGSSDDSVGRLRSGYPSISVVEAGGNRGYAGGCNLGMRRGLEMGASYLWLVNNDAVVDPGTLRRLIPIAERRREVRFFGSWIAYYDAPDRLWFGGGTFRRLDGRHAVSRWNEKIRRPLEAGSTEFTDWITGCSLLVRATGLAGKVLMDESYFLYTEELEWQLRCGEGHPRAIIVCEPLVRHKVGASTGGADGYLAPLFMSRNYLKMARTTAGWAWPLWALAWLDVFVARPIVHRRWRDLRAGLRGAFLQSAEGAQIVARFMS